MKANLENLIKALKLRFENDRTNIKVKVFCNDDEIDSNIEGVNLYYDDVQVGVMSSDVPIVTDVRYIVRAFFKNAFSIINVEESWNFIEMFVSDGEWADEVDTDYLRSGMTTEMYEKMVA